MPATSPPIDRPLEGKVAIVTGATRGIGRAAALGVARAGAAVVATGRDRTALQDLVESARAASLRVEGQVADALRTDDPEQTVKFATRRFGGVDLLVNSAGIQRYGTVVETDVSLWDEVLNTNLRSVFLMSKAVIPRMIDRGGGAIVNVSSVQAFVAQRGVAAYVASKAGINALTRAMAIDHAAAGIRVNVVCPASVDTPMLRWAADRFRGSRSADDVIKEWGASHPLGRVARAEEVAATIVFLLSEAASFVTGTELRVDGGLLAAVPVALPNR